MLFEYVQCIYACTYMIVYICMYVSIYVHCKKLFNLESKDS